MSRLSLPARSLRGRPASLRTVPDGTGCLLRKRLIWRALLVMRPAISAVEPIFLPALRERGRVGRRLRKRADCQIVDAAVAWRRRMYQCKKILGNHENVEHPRFRASSAPRSRRSRKTVMPAPARSISRLAPRSRNVTSMRILTASRRPSGSKPKAGQSEQRRHSCSCIPTSPRHPFDQFGNFKPMMGSSRWPRRISIEQSRRPTWRPRQKDPSPRRADCNCLRLG